MRPWKRRDRPNQPPPVTRDRASLGLRQVILGGGAFDVSPEHPNKKGWDIFELGQRSFWAVPEAVDWDQPVREDPEYSDAIAEMLTFLCPGEKAAVTGATLISSLVKSEEAQFYFAQQALEEAKHYDAMRRIIPKMTGRPMPPPHLMVRLLYSFGVVDRDDVAFTMGSINIIGEHLAHSILHRIRAVATDPQLKKLLALIAKDESRHIAAGKKFFPEVFPEFKKHRHRIMAKNLATTVVLLLAGNHLVNPMQKLEIDLGDVLDSMYTHYHDVTQGFPAFPDQAVFDVLLRVLKRSTPMVIRSVQEATNRNGRVEPGRLVALCERALKSPRALRRLFAA